MTWTCFTIPRRPKNRLDFCGGLRFTHSHNQTVLQLGTARRYLQLMFVKRRPTYRTNFGHLLHISFETPKGKQFWLRLSTRPSQILLKVSRWMITPRRVHP